MQRSEQQELAKQVATELGWQTKPDSKWGNANDAPLDLLGPNGEEFSIHSHWNDRSKVSITGQFPKDSKGQNMLGYKESAPSISVSFSRGPGVIAKEIKRRLMPEYQPLFESVLERLQSNNSYNSKQAANKERVLQIMGDNVYPQFNNADILQLHSRSGMYGDIETSADSITMHLRSVPTNLALEVFELIRKRLDERKEKQ